MNPTSLATLLLLGLLACDAPLATQPATDEPRQQETPEPTGDPQQLPTIEMRLGNLRFNLQVANDPIEREIGLMHVTEMAKKDGMIFVFPQAGEMGFWMKDTHIPLDIIFVDPTGQVIKIARMEPGDTETTNSDGWCQWVIELNAGMASEAGIKTGDVLFIAPEIRPETAE